MFIGLSRLYEDNHVKWEIDKRGKDYKVKRDMSGRDVGLQSINGDGIFVKTLPLSVQSMILTIDDILFNKHSDISIDIGNIWKLCRSDYLELGEVFPILLAIQKLMFDNHVSWDNHTSHIRANKKKQNPITHPEVKTSDLSVGTQRKSARANKLKDISGVDSFKVNFNLSKGE